MNLENVDILVCGKSSPPLTACKNNALNVLPTAKNSRTVSFLRLIHSIVALLLRTIKGKSLRDGLVLPQALNLRTVSGFALKFLDCLLSEIYKKLPPGWHIVSICEHFHFVKYLIFIMFMRS